jgi:outer membrane protein TolC
MRLYTQIGLTLSCLSVGLPAQTPNALTNAAPDATAPPTPNQEARPLTMQETIQLALEHNFDIAIARYNTQISSYRLGGAYGFYDPQLRVGLTHSVAQSEPAQLDPSLQAIIGANVVPGRTSESDTIGGPGGGSMGITGYLPWGMTYDFSGYSRHDFGTQGAISQTGVYSSTFDTYSADTSVTLSQPLLRDAWIDANRLNIKLAKKDVKISEYDLLLRVEDVISRVQQAYYNLIAAQDEVRAREVSLELARKLVDENRQRVLVGTMASLDEKQAESQAALREADLIQARAALITQQNTLKDFISDNYETWHLVEIQPSEKLLAVPQAFDLQDSWRKGLALRPDFNKVRAQLERQGLQVSYDFNQLFPSLNLVGTYGRHGLDQSTFVRDPITGRDTIKTRDSSFSGTLADLRDESAPYFSYGVAMRMPLSFRAERNRYKADKAAQKQYETLVRSTHQQVLIEIDTAIKVAQADYQSVKASSTAREYAQIALDAEQKKYENGKSTPFVLLRLQNDVTSARSAEIRALAKYNADLSSLAFYEGTILDRNRITVQFQK